MRPPKDPCDAYVAGMDLRSLADRAERYEPKANGKEDDRLSDARTPAFTLQCLADVQPLPIDWVWEAYLARGKLTLLGGDPDLGKSLVVIDMAARLSTERHGPFGPRAHVGNTVFLCSEDSIADTIRPRAEAAGADVSRLHVLKSSIVRDGKLRSFTLQNDLDLLGVAVTRVVASLVIIDAITSYMGKVDNNSTTDVRAVLDPVSEWADKHKVSVIGVTHPPKAGQKNAIRQFTGSFAYVAAARIAFFVTKEPETDRNLLLAVKNNIGAKALGRGYRIATKSIGRIVAPYIQWDDAPVDYTADQAIAANHAALRDSGSLQEAKEFMRELLANGPIEAKEGKEATEANGISERTLSRARQELGVKASKHGYQGTWTWRL